MCTGEDTSTGTTVSHSVGSTTFATTTAATDSNIVLILTTLGLGLLVIIIAFIAAFWPGRQKDSKAAQDTPTKTSGMDIISCFYCKIIGIEGKVLKKDDNY